MSFSSRTSGRRQWRWLSHAALKIVSCRALRLLADVIRHKQEPVLWASGRTIGEEDVQVVEILWVLYVEEVMGSSLFQSLSVHDPSFAVRMSDTFSC